jgi:hypothetical protein
VAVPEPAKAVEDSGPKKFEDLSTERLQAAHDALTKVGVPEAVLQPYKDLLGERRAKESQTYDPAKRLEQLTATRNRLAKRREEQQNEVDEQKARLERAENRLKKTIQYLEIFQAEINQAMAETNDAAGTTKRASEPPSGLRAIQSALMQPDEALAKHPDYVQYATTTASAGNTPMPALRWHLSKELGALAAEEPLPATKRACTSSSARTTDADGDDVL